MGFVGSLFSPPKVPEPAPPPPPPGQIIRAYGRTLDLSKPGDVEDYENLQRREAEEANRQADLTPPQPPAAPVEDGPSPEQLAQEESAREARRALAGATSRRSTLLTGGLGVTDPAPVRRRGLLGTG